MREREREIDMLGKSVKHFKAFFSFPSYLLSFDLPLYFVPLVIESPEGIYGILVLLRDLRRCT